MSKLKRHNWTKAMVGGVLLCLGGALYAEEQAIPYIYLSPEKKNTRAQFPPGEVPPGMPSNLDNNPPPAYEEPSNPGTRITPRGGKTAAKTGASAITKVERGNGPALYTMDYRDADIQDVVQDISEITGRNFLLDPKVKGPITIISPAPIDKEAVWEVFLSALEVRDYTIVETGAVTKVVPLANASTSPLKTYAGDFTPRTENYITRLYTLENVKATDMVTAINPLISKRGNVQAYKQTNTLIITDSGANIQRIIKIIKQLDREGAREQLEVITLKFANPVDVAEKIASLYQTEESGSPTSSGGRRGRGAAAAVPAGVPGVQSGESPMTVSQVLPDERTNSVIIVATDKALVKIKEFVRQIDVEVKNPKGNIHVYYLEHAKAEELATVLHNLATGAAGGIRTGSGNKSGSSTSNTPRPSAFNRFGVFPQAQATPAVGAAGAPGSTSAEFSQNLKITADPSTNSLLISSTQQDFETLKEVIKKLDIPRRQVFVETVIMELAVNQDRNIGISLSGGANPGGNPIIAGTSFTGLNPLALSASSLAGLSGLNAAGLSQKTIPITLSDGTTTSVPAFSAVLQALETATNVNILSTPNILTTDNQEAEIVVGQNIPFVTESGRDSNNNPIIQVQRQDVAITLRVTPYINENNNIRLDVFQEITELIPNQNADVILNQGPSTTKRSAKTTVVVKGEQTAVLGGLIGDKATISESRIPFLGSIPILGWLFKNQQRQLEKRNLLIFLTPYVINSPEDFKKILVKKIEERNAFVKRNYGWWQRREIRASLEYHQKALADIASEVERNRKKKAKKKTAGPSSTGNDITPPSHEAKVRDSAYRQDLQRQEVDVDRLLETY